MVSIEPVRITLCAKAALTRCLAALVMIMLAASLAAAGPQVAAQAPGDLQMQSQPQLSGDRFYCGERKLGTWFYCDKPKPQQPTPPSPGPPETTAAERLAAITKQLDELKARAILDPSPENVSAYIRFQRQQLDRAGTFADQWQRAIWAHASLDYTLERPVSKLGREMWIDARNAARDQTLAALRERYGLYYFFATRCAACKLFTPILKALAQSKGLDVYAVSTDGVASPQWPGARLDPQLATRFGLERTVPALVLFDTQTRTIQVVGYGVMAADDIMERIFVLTRMEVGRDF